MTTQKEKTVGTAGKRRTSRAKAPSPLARALWRLGAIIVTCFLILGAVLALVYRDTVSLDGLVRLFAYANLERDEDGAPVPFTFSSDSSNAYATAGNDLLVCSGNELQLYSVSGGLLLEQDVSMQRPAAQSAGNTAIVYDLGGNDLYVIRDRQVVFTYSTQERYSILSARVNAAGTLAIVEEAAGYKAAVTVYDSANNPLLRENLSSVFVMDAMVSPDNSTLAVAALSQEDTAFVGAVELYDCASGDRIASASMGSSTILDFYWTGKQLRVQLENGIAVVNQDGSVAGRWSDEGQYLQGFSITGLDYSVQLMGKYKAGSTGQLILIGDDASEHASIGVREEVLSISAAERYVAVLTANRLLIYTEDLEAYAETENVGATTVLMREDGSAMLVGNGSARLYVP